MLLAAAFDCSSAPLMAAQTLLTLDHPHIVTLHGVCMLSGTEFALVLAFASGGSVAAVLARGAVSVEEARRMLAQIAAGLAYLHARGVAHCDLKPANVLIMDGGKARAARAYLWRMAAVAAVILLRVCSRSHVGIDAGLPHAWMCGSSPCDGAPRPARDPWHEVGVRSFGSCFTGAAQWTASPHSQ